MAASADTEQTRAPPQRERDDSQPRTRTGRRASRIAATHSDLLGRRTRSSLGGHRNILEQPAGVDVHSLEVVGNIDENRAAPDFAIATAF
jgi:hypothetical protein